MSDAIQLDDAPAEVPPPIPTARMQLIAWNVAFIDALAAKDSQAVAQATGARMPEPFRAPPETDDVLPYFRDMLAANPDWSIWPPRLLVERYTRIALGSAGIMGPPGDDGAVLLGYGVYREFEGQGYASEAARALVDWAWNRPEVQIVRATIHPWNEASRHVAANAGLRSIRRYFESDEGTLEIWEIARPMRR